MQALVVSISGRAVLTDKQCAGQLIKISPSIASVLFQGLTEGQNIHLDHLGSAENSIVFQNNKLCRFPENVTLTFRNLVLEAPIRNRSLLPISDRNQLQLVLENVKLVLYSHSGISSIVSALAGDGGNSRSNYCSKSADIASNTSYGFMCNSVCSEQNELIDLGGYCLRNVTTTFTSCNTEVCLHS